MLLNHLDSSLEANNHHAAKADQANILFRSHPCASILCFLSSPFDFPAASLAIVMPPSFSTYLHLSDESCLYAAFPALPHAQAAAAYCIASSDVSKPTHEIIPVRVRGLTRRGGVAVIAAALHVSEGRATSPPLESIFRNHEFRTRSAGSRIMHTDTSASNRPAFPCYAADTYGCGVQLISL